MASDLVQPQTRLHPAPTRHNMWSTPTGMQYEEFRAMGTTVALLLPEEQFRLGFEVTQQLFKDWEQTLSRFLPESELSRLNAQAGTPVEVSPLLFRVLYAAWAAAQETEGLFDPTLLHQLVDIGYDRSFDTLPATIQKSTRPAHAGGGWREMRLNHRKRSVTLPEGVAVEVGGIAKGMAVDAALAQLKVLGIETAMVNAGGDLAVAGLPPGQDSWSLSVMGMDTTWVIPFQYGALATSGINKRHWQQGDRARHHIVDPRSGESSASGLWSVTVAAGSCQDAEVAAKAAFLLGAQQGAHYLNDHGLSGLLIRTDGSWTSAGVWPTKLMKTLGN